MGAYERVRKVTVSRASSARPGVRSRKGGRGGAGVGRGRVRGGGAGGGGRGGGAGRGGGGGAGVGSGSVLRRLMWGDVSGWGESRKFVVAGILVRACGLVVCGTVLNCS